MPLDMVEITGGTKTSTTAASMPATSTHAMQHGVLASPNAPTAHLPERLDSGPACCNDRLYGPHTSTIRMNPYVRCVHGSGVPEIRSLKELLSLKNQPAPAEPDTPCLRPTNGPSYTWQGYGDRCGAAATAEFCSFHEHPRNQALMTPAETSAAAASSKTNGQASSPILAFTADSVATPNTFATVVTHEKRIISHLTRRLRNSVKRHQDMPFGEPMEMVLSEGEDESEDGDHASLAEGAGSGDLSVSASFDAACNQAEDVDVGEVPMLPCSTREKAAEIEAHHTGITATITTTVTSSCSTSTTTDKTPQRERTVVRSCTSAPREQKQWLMQEKNELIVSPHSSPGMLCEFPGVQVAAEALRYRPPQSAHSTSSLHALPSSHHHTQQGQGPHHSLMSTAALRSYPAPVAKLEESPYHYIMRNYVGGTFLYYSTAESKDYFLRLCHRVVAQVRPLLEQQTLSPHHGLFPRLNAPAYVFGDIHGNFEDLSFFLKRLLIFHDFNLTPANILCLGDYVDRGPFSLECVMLLFSLKIMNASKIVMLRGNHEDRVVCGDLQTYGRGCFLGQCQTVFGYTEGMRLFNEVTALFRYLPLAAELVIPSTPNIAFLRSQQTVMHPNLYVSQPAVLLHDAAPAAEPPASSARAEGASCPYSSSPYGVRQLHPGGEVASGESGEGALSKSISSLSPSPIPSTASAAAAAGATTASPAAIGGYSTITDSSLARGQPSRHEAHEERILCAHGGIPRFDRPPLEENALNSLRSLAFPRMLTLFPNNPMVKDDPECAPDYFVKKELQTLWRRYPSMAPLEFTAASRREAAEAAAAAAATVSTSGPTPAACSAKTRRPVWSASCAQMCGNDNGQASQGNSSSHIAAGQHEYGRSGLSSPAASSDASSPCANPQAWPDNGSSLQASRPLLHRCSSRDLLPLPTDEEVRKAWYTMFDLLWSDPTPMELEEESAGACATTAGAAPASRSYINEWGFGINTRGSNVVSFSAKAVDTFLTAHHYSMLFRAHQEKAHGLRWSKSNKVLTIFSSSNYMGHGNGAGCVVVAANGEVQMVEKVCK
ncbi:Serine/threonine protein phosphatase-like protein [Leptomonas seymouri]|uniref:protein-serine/threonine phosphatase n=1 Tax=Leptomonas seymouri TaxID=5684 RepID=A0A0N1II84_LEPSE|nr:Serine/threonine protein phosphatase-like protein [Leptomonas seymouri]|eukprot:KPI84524.1 Serine/threonine protein phosphatase-like protein [Leptomonas seymouri]